MRVLLSGLDDVKNLNLFLGNLSGAVFMSPSVVMYVVHFIAMFEYSDDIASALVLDLLIHPPIIVS